MARKTPPPARRRPARAPTEPAPEREPLERFLVACQKSLARAVRSAQQSGKAENEFALGERPVYMIDSLEIELTGGLFVAPARTSGRSDCVLVDFDAPAPERSKLKFRVQSKPVELLKGAKLELVNLDPLAVSGPIARMRVWLVDDVGRPVADHQVELHFARAGEKRAKLPIKARTDAAGRVDFFIDQEKHELKIVGDRRRRTLFLRGSGRGINPDEYFVWATAEQNDAWKAIAEPSSPYPPDLKGDVDTRRGERPRLRQPAVLSSELHRLRID